jgi:hypothetical protein
VIAHLSLWCLFGTPLAGAVSSDDIDAYIGQVLKARKSCGPTSVWYCLRRLGHPVKLQEIWREASIEADGVRVGDLLGLFQSRGITAQALRGDPSRLETLPTLAILIIDDQHCIVYEGLDPENNMVRYFEPALGQIRSVPREEVQRHWSGEAIVLQLPLLSLRAFGAVAFMGFAGIISAAAALQWLWFPGRTFSTPAADGATVPP